MTGDKVTIFSDGTLINIDDDNLHVGDMVVLQAADIVPADLKLVEANGLEVDEFDITGELLPIAKQVSEKDIFLYAGSKVIEGTGKGIVMAIGQETEYGKSSNLVRERDQPYWPRLIEKRYLVLTLLLLPPLILQLAQSTTFIGLIAFYLLLTIILLVLQNNEYFKHVLVSREKKKLEDSKIRFRDVKALERMCNVVTLCFDKTGVLTTRQMKVKNIHLAGSRIAADSVSAIESDALRWVKVTCALCNDVSFWEKLELANPVDKALISFALEEGIDVQALFQHSRRIYHKPFDSEDRYMVCGFDLDGGRQYFAKGDPGVLQRMCKQYMTAAGERKQMEYEFWDMNLSHMQAINQSGDTVIALAVTADAVNNKPQNFTFLCLLQLENPLQVGAREIVQSATKNGIRGILLTGDRAETAERIAEQCGMTKDPIMVLTGGSIARMELREVARQSAYCSVFARLIPSQKGILIRLFQERGQCVGMVGDGVNDGIALKVADVGISFVENSSPVARRLAHILINRLDDLAGLIDSAHRVNGRVARLRIIRILLITGILFGVYLWVFIPRFPGG